MGNQKSSLILNSAGDPATSIFQFEVPTIEGGTTMLSAHMGKKAYIMVNVASQDQGFEVLAFPCNNFGQQEPGTNAEILEYAKNKGATFPVFGKLECENGEITHPLYKYLRASVSGGMLGQALKWNYTKFLCNSAGVPIKRYGPMQNPLSFEDDIVALLSKN